MSRAELIRAIAELIAGLQVPVSMPGGGQVLGAAYKPWLALFDEVQGFGWTNADEVEAALIERLVSDERD